MVRSRKLGFIRCLVATAVLGISAVAATAATAAPIGAYTTTGAWTFRSAPSLHPPKLLTDRRTVSTHLAAGDFLLDSFPNVRAPGPMTGEGGPLIVDNKLQPVWVHPVGTRVVSANLQQETYLGNPVLVFWQGVLTRTGAVSQGEVVVLDRSYRAIATLRARAPWVISLHDATITGGDIWVTVYRNVPNQNLSVYGGARKDTVYDVGIQEYDLTTRTLLYTWDALNPGGKPNVPLSASEQPAIARSGTAWDAYHLNSVQVLPGNLILLSMRNTSAVYLINTATNRTIWTLGGKRSFDNFTMPANARFSWQHDAELFPNGELTLFADNCCRVRSKGTFERPDGPSQGMVLRLNPAVRSVSLAAKYPFRPTRNVAFLGSMQLLPGGNALVGWGSLPYFSEYTRSGTLLLDAVFPGKDESYRAQFSATWLGTPSYPPSGAARTSRGKTTVYASWNGATEVSSWQVLAGSTARRLGVVATKPKQGFETAIALNSRSDKAFKVVALNRAHRVLGTSAAFG
jgi:hypothetical protein